MSHPVLQAIERDKKESVERLKRLLEIPSVSTDPSYAEHIQTAAHWVAEHLTHTGLTAQILPTQGHPAVVAQTSKDLVANPEAPRVLFYGHYDVQPPDPVEKWTTPPFEPDVRDGADGPAVFARGACDDKGQIMCFLEALRAIVQEQGKLPCPITVLIEGEEEIGSEHLPDFVQQHRDLLQADTCIVCDTSMWDSHTPAITYALRGLVYFDVKLHGPRRDLHSGVYGGTLANPATVLARVLGRLHDDDYRITIPNFYDDVEPVNPEEFEQWSRLGFKEEDFVGSVGSEMHGEAGYTTLERRWARPACDINGLYGGYMGEGAKTVIPAYAGAKVSFRIPAKMDPVKVSRQFIDWLNAQDVGGCRWEITNHGEAHPVMTPTDSPYLQAAMQALDEVSDQPPALVREGATIPVVADFQRCLGLDTLLIGFGLNSDSIHSPDEHFGINRYLLGQKALTLTLEHMAKVKS